MEPQPNISRREYEDAEAGINDVRERSVNRRLANAVFETLQPNVVSNNETLLATKESLPANDYNMEARLGLGDLVDCSGSMDGSKIESAKAAAALLMYSVKDFNSELGATRSQTHSKLRANTEVIVFGSDFETIKHFERDKKTNNNEAEIITSVSAINDNLGASQDSEITTECLEKLKNEGVLVVGFQIGNVSLSERNTFGKIWNSNEVTGELNKKGIYIGRDVSELPDKLMSALSESLNNIII